MIENLALFLTPMIGLLLIAAFVWWQNERDAARRDKKK
jgi:hypothetical protein